MTIGTRITFSFAMAVGITGVLGLFAYSRISTIDEAINHVTTRALPGVKATSGISADVQGQRGEMLIRLAVADPQLKADQDKVLAQIAIKVDQDFATYAAACTTDDDRHRCESLEASHAKWADSLSRILQLSRKGDDRAALDEYLREGDAAFDQFFIEIGKVADVHQSFAEREVATANTATDSAKFGIVTYVLVACAAAITLGTLLILSINRVLKRLAGTLSVGAEQTATAAAQVAGSSQALAQGASEQAASLEETSSSLEEMSGMTRKNAETAQQAAVLSADAKAAAEKGNHAMDRMASAIADIQKSAMETAKIVKTIDEIAFQTNLLALNAAVEAARAGDAGRGFAVVAEEVRNLAIRSAEAARNTSVLIDQSVQNARGGVAIAGDVAKTLEEINTGCTKVNALIAEIAAASSEQSQGIGQVNIAVAQMDKVTQQTSANAEESAAASEQLASQAVEMSTVVSELTQIVSGARRVTDLRSSAGKTKPNRSRVTPAIAPKGRAAKLIPLGDEDARSKDFSEFNKAA